MAIDPQSPEFHIEATKLFVQLAGFLSLIQGGGIPAPEFAKKEATELLNKIGALLAPLGGFYE